MYPGPRIVFAALRRRTPMELPKIGDRLLGKYVLERTLGEGGMGVVFAARHELLEQRVAVKLIRPEYMAQRDAVSRFLNEARAAARIENDHVARVLDVGTLEGELPYMVLEYLDGVDLGHVLRQRGSLPVTEAVDALMETIEGVAHAHAVGIIHRDLKPSNLFLSRRPDGTSRVKVLDFGISKTRNLTGAPQGEVTRTNAMLGSPLFMSPEQLRDSKNVDQRCDVWALGVIAFQLLTGKTPFMADNAVALFAAISESDPPGLRTLRPDAAIPPALEAAVLRCLKRRPEDRFESVTDLGAALAPHGSVKSVRALENAERILPRSPPSVTTADALLAGLGPVEAASTVRPSQSSVPGSIGQAQTVDHWAKSAGTTKPRSSAAPLAIIAVAILLLAGVGLGVGPRLWKARSSAVGSSPSSLSSAALPSAATDIPASASGSAATSGTAASAVSAPTVSAPVVIAASSERSLPKPKPAVATPPATPPAAPPTSRPTAAASSPPPPAKNCSPPFWYDAAGTKHFKPECMP